MAINKAILLGRLGQDPVLRYTQTGAPVCNFSMATEKTWKDQSGQRQAKTSWHQICVFGKLAEIAQQYLKKGSQIYLEGEIDYQTWEGKDGEKKYKTQIIASEIKFVGGVNREAAPGDENQDHGSGSGDDDIRF